MNKRFAFAPKIRLALILSLPLFLAGPPLFAQARMHALLIAVGDYPTAGGWHKISSANDVAVVREALQKRGFQPQDIVALTDAAATRTGILAAIQKNLLEKVRPGDVAYFQFSGHGQQVADQPGGDEMDGFDEAIVPFDSPVDFVPGQNEGQFLIRDDELGELFTAIRRRLGPGGNLMVVLDACHSGTGTRGMEISRGTNKVMASPDFVKNQIAQNRPANLPDPFATGLPSAELAPMAAFFGAAQNQLNFETRDDNGQQIGSLSFALAKKLSLLEPKTTYRGLFENVKLEMAAIAPRQQPQAEGTLDQELLGGNLREQPRFYTVTHWNDVETVKISGGWMHGLNEGCVLGFFAPETRDPQSAEPFARGSVQSARPFEATVLLEKELSQEVAAGCWVYLLEQNFGNVQVNVQVNLPENHPNYAPLMEKIATCPAIKTGENPEIWVSQNGAETQIWSGNDFLLETIPGTVSPKLAATRIVRRVLSFAQAKFLRQMEASSRIFQVDMELVPIRMDERTMAEIERIPREKKLDGSGNLHFQQGDVFKIRLTNRGEKAAYFSVIDIQPDNEINVLVPGEGEQPAEFRISAGQSLEVPRFFQIGPPAGSEVFKLVATEQAIDLRPIAQSRGQATRANRSPFETLFSETFVPESTASRGGKTINLAAGSIHIFSSTFIID